MEKELSGWLHSEWGYRLDGQVEPSEECPVWGLVLLGISVSDGHSGIDAPLGSLPTAPSCVMGSHAGGKGWGIQRGLDRLEGQTVD